MTITRRGFFHAAAGGAAASLGAARTAPAIALGFSLSGMREFRPQDALEACGRMGYDAVELALMEGWPTEPSRLDEADRTQLRYQFADLGLRAPALMEKLDLTADDAAHERNLERIRQAAYLGRELSPMEPPLLETVLGGRPDQWDELKGRMAERLADWARVALHERMTIALKPDVRGAAHLPEHALWLIKRTSSRRIKVVYDYSHYRLRGLGMEETLRPLLPHLGLVHAQDAAGAPEKPRFLLPGDGDIDYARLLALLAEGDYRGAVVVEVSRQLQIRNDYDPLRAAEKSRRALARAFEQAGVARP